jgi:hypothetical protein
MKKVLTLGVAVAVVCVIAAVAAIALNSSSEDTTPIPSALASVCKQNETTPAPDVIAISKPEAGAAITSPLDVKGSINAPGGTFFISLVTADGQHIIDYPAHSQTDTFVPFEQQVPFSIFEQTPACVWVYRQNADDLDTVRIPVVIQPQPSPTNGGQ